MCGIAGFVGQRSEESLREPVLQMMDALTRRGPDSGGVEAWPGAVLGHRRLAILDLSPAGHQPMLSDDRQLGVVFNGCIYNFLDIRADLEKLGHKFRSRCDTEVLLSGYKQWGIDEMVRRLRGMFAFAIWDSRKQKLFLVRDRLGVKPLVYAVRDGCIGFASTVAALHAADLVGDIDPEAVLDFLEFDWVSDARAIFSGARKVPAATIIEFDQGRISERRYWTLPEPASRQIGFDEAVEQTESLLIEAAKLRLISDVPIGALLSGGIDSGLTCWAMSKVGANVTSFTMSTPGDPADESQAARATAAKLGIPHEVIELPTSEQVGIDELIDAYGEPFACSSALGVLRISKAVKPRVTVLLTGDGGDDIFLGYPHYRTLLNAQRASRFLPSALASVWPSMKGLVNGPVVARKAWRLGDYATGGLGAVLEAHNGLQYLYSRGMLGERFGSAHRPPRVQRSFQSVRHMMPQLLEYERSMRFVAEFMTKVDGGAAHYAIEARSPFLDQQLWEFAASLPFELRLRGGELKAVLRAIARKHLGEEVASRRKQGFTVPLDRWLAGKWRGSIEALEGDSLLEQDGWIRPGTLRPAVREALQRGSVPRQLWCLVVLEQWLRRKGRASATAVLSASHSRVQ